jgi:glycosyltransferase involved in cell wall biosynthesis
LEAARYLGIYIIYTIHNIYTWLDDVEFAARSNHIMKAHRIVAVSSFVRDYFVRRAGVNSELIDVIMNGIDVDGLTALGSTKVDSQALGLPSDTFIFAHVASFHRVKHQALIIGAVELLRRERNDFHVALIGNAGDKTYYNEICEMLKASSARQHITICSYLNRGQMAAAYRNVIDCVLLATLQEGCSNVVLEALAFNKMIIMTDVGNARDVAKLTSRVRIIDRTVDVYGLSGELIETLSRSSDTANKKQLSRAMSAAIDERLDTDSSNEEVLRLIEVERMGHQYASLIRAEGILTVG